eukprot:s883_g9.t1
MLKTNRCQAVETGQKAQGSRLLRELLLPESSADYARELHRWVGNKAKAVQRPVQEIEPGKWAVQLANWRHDLGIPKSLKSPWVGNPQFKGASLSMTDRIRGLLDVVVWEKLGRAASSMSFPEKQERLANTYVDISQNPCRRPCNNSQGIMGTMTTSSIYYSYFRDGAVLPFEMLLWHGHSRLLKIPDDVKGRDLKELAGEGMSAPCLGSILWAGFLLNGYK